MEFEVTLIMVHAGLAWLHSAHSTEFRSMTEETDSILCVLSEIEECFGHVKPCLRTVSLLRERVEELKNATELQQSTLAQAAVLLLKQKIPHAVPSQEQSSEHLNMEVASLRAEDATTDEKDSLILALNAEIKQLKETQATQTNEHEGCRVVESELESEKELLRKEIELLRCENASLSADRTQWEREECIRAAAIAEKENTVRELEQRVLSLETENKILKKTNSSLKAENEGFEKSANDDFEHALKTSEADIELLKTSLEELTAEKHKVNEALTALCSESEERLQKLRGELVSLNDLNSSLTARNEALEAQLRDFAEASSECDAEQYRITIAALEESLKTEQDVNAGLRDSVERVELELRSLRQDTTKDKLQEQLDSLVREKNELSLDFEKRMSEKLEQIDDFIANTDKLNSTIDAQKQQLRQGEQRLREFEGLKDQLAERTETIASLKDRIVCFEKEIAAKKEQVEISERKYQQELMSFEEKNRQLQESAENSQRSLKDSETRLFNLDSSLKKIQKRNEELLATSEDQTRYCNDLHKRIDELNAADEEKYNELREVKESFASVKDSEKQLREACIGLEAKVHENLENCRAQQRELETKQEALAELERRNEDLRMELTTARNHCIIEETDRLERGRAVLGHAITFLERLLSLSSMRSVSESHVLSERIFQWKRCCSSDVAFNEFCADERAAENVFTQVWACIRADRDNFHAALATQRESMRDLSAEVKEAAAEMREVAAFGENMRILSEAVKAFNDRLQALSAENAESRGHCSRLSKKVLLLSGKLKEAKKETKIVTRQMQLLKDGRV